MKTFKNIIALTLVTLLAFSCKNEVKPEVKTIEAETTTETAKLDPNATYAKAEFTIDGMTCEIGCAKTIEKKIAKMEGVKSATVDFNRKLAMVEYNDAKVTPTNLEETVVKIADDLYKVSDMKTVEDFSSKKACTVNCAKACCTNKTEAEKKTCEADCKKACCVEKSDA